MQIPTIFSLIFTAGIKAITDWVGKVFNKGARFSL